MSWTMKGPWFLLTFEYVRATFLQFFSAGSDFVRQAVLVLVSTVLFGGPCHADLTVSSSETLIRLNMSPALAPNPALRYLLLPELSEMKPGNPIHGYYKCCMEARAFLYDKEAMDRCEEWLAMPFNELPAPQLQDLGRSALGQMDAAARLDTPDWQILQKLKSDGISLLLPDVQGMRGWPGRLQVRFRSEVALGRIDDALRSSKTMFAMSRHLGEHPTDHRLSGRDRDCERRHPASRRDARTAGLP